MNSFEKWFDDGDFDGGNEYSLAKDAYKAGMLRAADISDSYFKECFEEDFADNIYLGNELRQEADSIK